MNRQHQSWVASGDDSRPITFSSGFTLVELLVVIVIMGLLLSILLPGVLRARDRALSARCLSNLRQIGIAQKLYSAEHGGNYTPTWQPGTQEQTWQELLAPYIGSDDRTDPALALSCPSASPSPEGANRASYALNVFITWPEWNYRATIVPSPSKIILLGDAIESNSDVMFYADREQAWGVPGFRHNNEEIANMLFCDGSARGMKREELMLNSGHWRWW